MQQGSPAAQGESLEHDAKNPQPAVFEELCQMCRGLMGLVFIRGEKYLDVGNIHRQTFKIWHMCSVASCASRFNLQDKGW